MSTEHQRIARIRALFSRASPAILLGIGDDCAVLAPSTRARVWTVDAAIENVHFARRFMRDDEIGYRALMAAASDIAAMGAEATAILCALGLPVAFRDEELDALLHGYAQAAELLACPVVGGNLARAGELSITSSVIGEAQAPLTRAGARPNQGLFVTGTLGGAALGLRALQSSEARDGRYAECIGRFLRPRARLDLVAALNACASAAIDVSDGLAQDLEHLCRASGVGARVVLPSVPRPKDFDALAQALECDANALVLSGGEDYELLFTADAEHVSAQLATQIGVITSEPTLRIVAADGTERSPPLGFDHFR